jgi:hypothetical protein
MLIGQRAYSPRCGMDNLEVERIRLSRGVSDP